VFSRGRKPPERKNIHILKAPIGAKVSSENRTDWLIKPGICFTVVYLHSKTFREQGANSSVDIFPYPNPYTAGAKVMLREQLPEFNSGVGRFT
jgi:hypothetical protein